MTEKYECTVCRATARIDMDQKPIRYDSFYPAETGPYAARQPVHACPIRQGLIPPKIEGAPNARRVE